MEEKLDIDYLANSLEIANKAYHETGTSHFSDEAYDRLLAVLAQHRPDHPLVTKVGAPVAKGVKVKLRTPMKSLDKVHTFDEFKAWWDRVRPSQGCTVLPKYDGVSISLYYTNGQLVQAVTRGDGLEGQDVTHIVRRAQGVYSRDMSGCGEQHEVRGELVLPLSEFNKLPQAKHPRNVVAGVLAADSDAQRMCSPAVLQFRSFGDAEPSILCSSAEAVRPWYIEALHAIDTHQWDFAADGIVISLRALEDRKRLGETDHHPNWAIAWKFPPRRATGIVSHIAWQTSGFGVVTPVLVLTAPVLVDGAAVGNVTLHNLSTAESFALRTGDVVEISRRGGVIPHVEQVLVRNPDGLACAASHKCTACSAVLKREKRPDSEVLVCPNDGCPAAVARRIERWCKSLGVLGFGPAVCDALQNAGVDNYLDLYQKQPQWAAALSPQLGAGVVNNLQLELRRTKVAPADKLLFALCLPGMGEVLCRRVAKAYTLDQLSDATAKELSQRVSGIGLDTAADVLLALRMHWLPLAKLVAGEHLEIIELAKPGAGTVGPLAGQVVCFTGELAVDRTMAMGAAEAAGAEISTSVTKKTTILVAADSTPSAKYKKAQQLGVRIMDGPEYLALVGLR